MPVIIEDFMPTILAAADVDLPADLPQIIDGRNFLPLMLTRRPTPEEEGLRSEAYATFSGRDLIWHFPHTYDGPPYSAIRRGTWKLVYWYVDERVELYNLANDISEIFDVAEGYPRKVEELQAALITRLKERGALLPQINQGAGK